MWPVRTIWRAVFVDRDELDPRRLPAAAAFVAGDDAAPATGARIADQPAATAGVRRADRDVDRDDPAAADAASDLAAARRRDRSAGHRERAAVGRAAIAPPGE